MSIEDERLEWVTFELGEAPRCSVLPVHCTPCVVKYCDRAGTVPDQPSRMSNV